MVMVGRWYLLAGLVSDPTVPGGSGRVFDAVASIGWVVGWLVWVGVVSGSDFVGGGTAG